MTTATEKYVQAIRDLRVLPDMSEAGQIDAVEYTNEWRRLAGIRDEAAARMTREQIAEARERAQYAC